MALTASIYVPQIGTTFLDLRAADRDDLEIRAPRQTSRCVGHVHFTLALGAGALTD